MYVLRFLPPPLALDKLGLIDLKRRASTVVHGAARVADEPGDRDAVQSIVSLKPISEQLEALELDPQRKAMLRDLALISEHHQPLTQLTADELASDSTAVDSASYLRPIIRRPNSHTTLGGGSNLSTPRSQSPANDTTTTANSRNLIAMAQMSTPRHLENVLLAPDA